MTISDVVPLSEAWKAFKYLMSTKPEQQIWYVTDTSLLAGYTQIAQKHNSKPKPNIFSITGPKNVPKICFMIIDIVLLQ